MVRLSTFNVRQKAENEIVQNMKSESSYNEDKKWTFAFPRKASFPVYKVQIGVEHQGRENLC